MLFDRKLLPVIRSYIKTPDIIVIHGLTDRLLLHRMSFYNMVLFVFRKSFSSGC